MNAIAQSVAAVFNPSPQQVDFFDWIVNGEGSCVLKAVAGSGKTTALVKGIELMKGSKFFGAYNKKIADEIASKVIPDDETKVSTMHAAGFAMWRKVAPNVKVETNKCRDIYRVASDKYPEYRQYEGQVLELVSLAKQAAVGVLSAMNDKRVWLGLIEHFDIDCMGEEIKIIMLARKTLEKSIEQDMKIIDFNDMIYAPLIHKVRATKYDWVLIDEAQDTNASRRELALLMLKEGGRLVAVGDPHQAIYGFTGADSDALDRIGAAVNAIDMPLTVSYRCPKSVVFHAQKYVSHIEAHPDAPEGSVVAFDGKLTVSAKPGDAILCRFNAPIIKLVYQFIAEGVPAKVEGREIGTGLKALARRWKTRSFDTLIQRLETFCEREVAKCIAEENPSRAEAVADKVECLKVLITRVSQLNPRSVDPIGDLCKEIDTLFDDNVGSNKVLLSTIHKSKGREWHNVYWLQTGPSKWAKQAWELEQEKNLCYVAATRAKSSLFLAPVPAQADK